MSDLSSVFYKKVGDFFEIGVRKAYKIRAEDSEKLFNLVYNAAIMVKAGVGYALTLDNLADTSADSDLCFRPLYPRLESGLNLIWKKYQIFSPAADLFLKEVQARFQTDPI